MSGADRDQSISRGFALLVSDAQQKVRSGDVLIAEVSRLFEGLVEGLGKRVARAGLCGSALDARQFLLDLVKAGLEPFCRDPDLLQYRGNDAFAIRNEGEQQVDRLEFRITV